MMARYCVIRVAKTHTGEIMIKVVYNACYGGFGLSRKAAERLAQLGVESADKDMADYDKRPKSPFGFTFNPSESELPRHDPRLVQVVEELGDDANGAFADLQIAQIEGNKYRIDEYDGSEGVQTPEDIEWVVVS